MDTIGAFMGAPALLAPGVAGGPLDGCRLAVKDLFDVAGTVTGAGNPAFAENRPPATCSAPAVQRLVDSGASVIGKTITDELAWSLAGTNVHYGMPRNVAAPGRVPGGSSAGSAAAVAAGLADLALGTDTGGSVRIPASYCGIYGWRPTHGAVPSDGVVPLARSFDVVGLFARDIGLLTTAATALLGGDPAAAAVPNGLRLALAAETLDDAAHNVAVAVREVAAALDVPAEPLPIGVDLGAAVLAFRHLQGREAFEAHGAWIQQRRPPLGPGVAARFRAAAAVTDDEVAAAHAVRADVRAAMAAATAGGTVLVLPGAAGPAPEPHPDPVEHQLHRNRTLRLTCLAGLAGAPVVVAPMTTVFGFPLGVAFLGAPGTDLALLDLVARLTRRLGAPSPAELVATDSGNTATATTTTTTTTITITTPSAGTAATTTGAP